MQPVHLTNANPLFSFATCCCCCTSSAGGGAAAAVSAPGAPAAAPGVGCPALDLQQLLFTDPQPSLDWQSQCIQSSHCQAAPPITGKDASLCCARCSYACCLLLHGQALNLCWFVNILRGLCMQAPAAGGVPAPGSTGVSRNRRRGSVLQQC